MFDPQHKRLTLSILMAISLGCSKSEPQSTEESPQPNDSPQALKQAQASQMVDSSYSHHITEENITFHWNFKGDSIDIKLIAKTKGWVGVGFNPEPDGAMKGGNFIVGSVKDGKAEVVDHFGTLKTSHKADEKLGGTSHVSNVTGSEQGDQTEIAFTIPLNSGDATDTEIDPSGETIVLLAYGNSDNLVLKHKFRITMKVNLSTGKKTD